MKVTKVKPHPDNIILGFKTNLGTAMYVLPIFNYSIDTISDTLYIDSIVSSKKDAINIEKYLVGDMLVNGKAKINLYYLSSELHEFNEEIDEVYISTMGERDHNSTMFEFLIDIKNNIKDYAKFI